MRIISLLALLLLSGCAAHYVDPSKPVKNLSAFQQSSSTALIAGQCVQVVMFKNGRTVRLPLDAQICRDAETGLAVEQAMRNTQKPDGVK